MAEIALDASLWDEPTTGIGLYTRALWRAMAQEGTAAARLGARQSGEAPRGRIGATAWAIGQLPGVLAARRPALYHAVANFDLPLARVDELRYVLTVHDLIPELLPDTVSRPFHWQFRLWLRRSLKLADQVICVSEETRRRLLERCVVDPARVHVVPNGVDHVEHHPLDPDGRHWLESSGVPDRFILFAGALDVRKNVEAVLRALERLAARELRPPLVLVGQRWFGSGPAEKRIVAMQTRGYPILPLGFQPASVLYALMRRARALVFPSRYEGFGLPPLEAMWQGTPAIVSNAGALGELCRDAALQVEPDDVAALADAIEELFVSDESRAKWARRGQERARQFTWKRAAQATLDVYRAALDSHGPVRPT